ncbi:TPA: hypothetical protein N0F65_010526 [Lagenidium giganteum]|uniref:Heme haloperoxidase family profile domain-containing protein n=1 Tax=Lagenidium giganteum TaxID=4803 RepID=A0AAV2Z8S1_9STRA|nr:TPA: hypothetical protein N0F65_010526 [Lagenidium giganteum]
MAARGKDLFVWILDSTSFASYGADHDRRATYSAWLTSKLPSSHTFTTSIMVAITKALAVTALLVAAASAQPADLAVGDYYRPSGDEVTGFPGGKAPFRRSPCPAINTLANHGYIPRNGQNVTRDMLRDAIVEVFNFEKSVVQKLVDKVPETMFIDYLSTHGFIEHDVSLVHADFSAGKDPSSVDEQLAKDLLGRANANGKLGVKEIAQARRAREAACHKPECNFGSARENLLAYGETAFLLQGLGAKHDDGIDVEHARSFLVDERIPSDFVKAATPVTELNMIVSAGKVKAPQAKQCPHSLKMLLSTTTSLQRSLQAAETARNTHAHPPVAFGRVTYSAWVTSKLPSNHAFTTSVMVAITKALAVTALLVAAASAQPADLAVGDYYRPSGDEVTGFPGGKAPFRRSPCPAINTLANHGYIPRNGQNVTRDMLRDAIVEVFNFEKSVVQKLVDKVPETMFIDYLSTHGFIEHDVSLVHADFSAGKDPSSVDEQLAKDLLGRANANGKLGVKEIAQARRAREAACHKPECNFGSARENLLAYGETAFLLQGLGAKHDDGIDVEHARSFLVDERIPSDFVKAATPVTELNMIVSAGKVKARSLLPTAQRRPDAAQATPSSPMAPKGEEDYDQSHDLLLPQADAASMVTVTKSASMASREPIASCLVQTNSQDKRRCKKKQLRWSTITVHEFGVNVGGSSVSERGGPSIGLADVPEFSWTTKMGEMAECSEGIHRFTPDERVRLLQNAGVSDGIILRHSRETNIILGSRRRTMMEVHMEREQIQSLKRRADWAATPQYQPLVRRPRMIPASYVTSSPHGHRRTPQVVSTIKQSFASVSISKLESRMPKSVRWSTITVYEFGVGIGGSAVPRHGGPAIGLARKPECVWTTALSDEDVDDSEQSSGDESVDGAGKEKKRMSSSRRVRWLKPLERIQLLEKAGYSEKKIYRMLMESSKIASSRRLSLRDKCRPLQDNSSVAVRAH